MYKIISGHLSIFFCSIIVSRSRIKNLGLASTRRYPSKPLNNGTLVWSDINSFFESQTYFVNFKSVQNSRRGKRNGVSLIN